MAEVYWIHSSEHTDVFSQGYVGVTTKTAFERFKQHVKISRSNNPKKSIVHKVIKARGVDNLIVDTICICEEDYAYDLEYKLRPSKFIGWNQNSGGIKPPSQLGRKMRDETKSKLSIANSVPASPAKLKAILENSVFTVGYKRSESTKRKHQETMINNGPWNNPAANKDFWCNAEKFYEDYRSGMTILDVQTKYNLTRNSLKTIFKHFNKGWIPAEDDRWLSDFRSENT